jgi:hypothetical protein
MRLMSRGPARRWALGLALATAIVFVPARPAAADSAGEAFRAADLWRAAVEWLSAIWNPAPPGSPDGGGPSAAGACGGDEGVCIDPNG